ncbi:YcnI family protein [Pseudarthrobacter sp. J64]|uniref:YcnI family copper-binding membrane protein n=1 Tax=Pseudarthrobacter sp. J64 TaxID=3116485 RepID=UPI002E80D980|nr:YcnI family protein [Pseudarthrobacter sp. J64]MEE2570966.1 YcnI family protein [Pseudarthrobacter sp. J64]
MNNSTIRRALSATALAGGTAALLLAGVGPASAHVGVTPDKTGANGYALLGFAFSHGCEGAATTKITITLPQELNDATPTVNPNWTVEKVTETLAEPRKLADGSSITKRTSQIVYTAKEPVADGLRDALVLSAKLPDAAGTTLYFPTLQTCETGQTDWAEIPAEGQDPHDLEAPAPALTVTEAATEPASHADHAAEPAAATATDDSGAAARSWGGLAAGLGGLALGGVAFARSGRSAKQDATAAK